MKIRLYVVTYNSPRLFNDWFLRSLKDSIYDRSLVEVFVINNHSNFFIDDEFSDLVTVLNNDLRPDFSTGHLSRNWNQAIINGFEDLNNPKCDLVVTCQGDTKLKPNWYAAVIELANRYKYVCLGAGDQLQIFTVEAIKRIGLFDERFCGIGFQEADYFLRAGYRFGPMVSINDHIHGRLMNPIDRNDVIESTPPGSRRDDINHTKSCSVAHPICRQFYDKKWNMSGKTDRWFTRVGDDVRGTINFNTIRPTVPTYILYPYFEKDIDPSVYNQ